MSRDSLPPCGGRRFGNHGGEVSERKHGHCPAREHGGDRCHADDSYFHIWADLWRSLQPGSTLADASQGGISWRDALAYVTAQLLGAFIGVAVAHLMFGQALLQLSHHIRAGGGQLFSEFVATFGLLSVIWGCSRLRSEAVPVAVGLYITGAYWFTASTSFANPAVTLARAFTDTFAGIRSLDAPGFIVTQLLGAFAATVLFRWLVPTLPSEAKEIVFPRTGAAP